MQPGVRAASLHGYVELATSLGLDARALIVEAGLHPADLVSPDQWIPADAAAQLLAITAEQTHRDDFALLMARRRQLSTLGPLSLVLREEPSVRGALDLLIRYARSYNEALRLDLTEAGGLATVRLGFTVDRPVATSQTLLLAAATLVGIMRTFLGETWQPLSVCFEDAPPRDRENHQEVFGPGLHFDHEFTGIVASSHDLDRLNTNSDPALRPYAQRLLATLPTARPEPAADQVRQLIELLLPMGRASVDQVARSLSVDRRTLHRHLAGHDETFTNLLQAARRRLVERYLANPRYSLTEIADLVGFSASSALTRWFREQYGTSPSRWRATSTDRTTT